MSFYSLGFALFLCASLALYYLAHRFRQDAQWIVLLAASLFFYVFLGGSSLLCILVTSLSVWLAGLGFARMDAAFAARKKALPREQVKTEKQKLRGKKRAVLFSVIALNLLILAFFKYMGAFTESLFLHPLLVPLGISFYTFQTTGYLIDVYNGKYPPERHFARFLLFASFFPQLIQGPINRYDALAPQLFAPHAPDGENMKRGLCRIAFGMLKKYAVADVLAGSIAVILDNPEPNAPGSLIVLGILLYSIAQYADFSGGIDIVIGVAQLFGVPMAENFRQPYFATSLADFWRRWHISLGAWMRDYVFYPFALLKPVQQMGKRLSGKLGKHFGRSIPAGLANLLVFLLVGLWHGAQAHYIVWGLYNGLVIALSDLLAPTFKAITARLRINTQSFGYRIFQIVRTFIIVNIGWYFDRIEQLGDCLRCLANTVCNISPAALLSFKTTVRYADVAISNICLALFVTCFIFVHSVLRERNVDVYALLRRHSAALRWALYLAIIFVTLFSFTLSGFDQKGFMYANF